MLEDRILIVDDDPSWQELLRETIEGLGEFGLWTASSYAAADALVDRQHFHLAFVDLRLREDARDLDGKKLVRKLVEQDEGTSIVIATGHADVSTAITALREWKVLDFVLKDAWEPGKVAGLVRIGIPAARAAYRARYESAVERLRGDQPVLPWLAQVLQAVAAEAGVSRPDRRLSAFLNELLDGLYPLLADRAEPGVGLDSTTGIASARFWSKARGCPIALRFGRRDAIMEQARGLTDDFAAVERTVADEELGLLGIVAVPAAPQFEAFGSA